jgi:hypothetical protein
LYREIRAVCSAIHTEHINTLCGQNVEFVNVKLGGKMRWAGYVARMGSGEAYTRFWWGNHKERDHLGYPGVEDWRIILRWIFRRWDVGVWTESR